MAALGHVTLRMVKVPLPDNKEEILITNLPSEIFDHLKIAELYLMRWNKEGYFSQSSGFFYETVLLYAGITGSAWGLCKIVYDLKGGYNLTGVVISGSMWKTVDLYGFWWTRCRCFSLCR